MIRVVHIITGLNPGGAELRLYRLLASLDNTHFQSRVVSLSDRGEVGQRIEELGIPVATIPMRPTALRSSWKRLVLFLKEAKPDLVQTWMYHGDVIGGLAARRAGIERIVWGLQATGPELNTDRSSHVLLLAARVLADRLPLSIVSSTEVGARAHARRGFPPEKMKVIPTGFQIPAISDNTRAETRRRLGLSESHIVIGSAARFARVKDHRTLIRAVGRVARTQPNVRLLFCGTGMTSENRQLDRWLIDAGVREQSILVGHQKELTDYLVAMDVYCSSSVSEGFPSVVAEAMACSVPVVATEAGDSREMVGETGRIVGIRDEVGLAGALLELVSLAPEARRRLGEAARRRVADRFGIERMSAAFAELYESLVSDTAKMSD